MKAMEEEDTKVETEEVGVMEEHEMHSIYKKDCKRNLNYHHTYCPSVFSHSISGMYHLLQNQKY